MLKQFSYLIYLLFNCLDYYTNNNRPLHKLNMLRRLSRFLSMNNRSVAASLRIMKKKKRRRRPTYLVYEEV